MIVVNRESLEETSRFARSSSDRLLLSASGQSSLSCKTRQPFTASRFEGDSYSSYRESV